MYIEKEFAAKLVGTAKRVESINVLPKVRGRVQGELLSDAHERYNDDD